MEDLPLLAHDSRNLRYTWTEFVDLDDDDRRELVDGELIEVEVPNESHEGIVALLIHYLTAWTLARRAGKVYGSGYKIRVSDDRAVMPDIQFFRRGNPALALVRRTNRQAVAEGRPDLAVEVISPSSDRFDLVTKLQWYADIGVPEYWIVDSEARTVERLVLTGETYSVSSICRDGGLFRPDTFPGLEIPLDELWKSPDED